MNIKTILATALFTFLPLLELRFGIPYAYARQLPPLFASLFCTGLNLLISPLVFVFLNSLHSLLYKLNRYHRFFDGLVLRTRKKVHAKIEKYGYLGLLLFVAIPLPFTGAYTGALGAWIFDMNPRKSSIFIGIGVIIAGIIVSLVAYFGIEALSIFIKEVKT
ncbi:MAG: small multi-drug export protein [Spirochaetales bacterium]|nr:small multi-drug export protein [Spirochaetales bacterium]